MQTLIDSLTELKPLIRSDFRLAEDVVEDLSQDVALRVISRASQSPTIARDLSDPHRLRAYIKRALQNAARTYLQRRPKWLSLDSGFDAPTEPCDEISIEDAVVLVTRVAEQVRGLGTMPSMVLDISLGRCSLRDYASANDLTPRVAALHFTRGARIVRAVTQRVLREEYGAGAMGALRTALKRIRENLSELQEGDSQ